MQIPLTRIEYDYVIKTFFTDKPELFLQFEHFTYPITTGRYHTENHTIYFRSNQELPQHPITVYFQHKQRTICFFSTLRKQNEYYKIQIPLTAYKYNKAKKQTEKNVIHLYTAENNISTAYEDPRYPLDTINQDNTDNTTKTAQEKSDLPLFQRRIIEFEKNSIQFSKEAQNNTDYFLFIDDSYLIITYTGKKTQNIEKLHPIKFTIHFPVQLRTIYALQHKLCFSRKIPQSKAQLLCFTLLYQHEEDRRFLYERVHHKKYCPIPTQSRAAFSDTSLTLL